MKNGKVNGDGKIYIMSMNAYEGVRDEVVDYLLRDLYGPYGGETEILKDYGNDSPLKRYATGILYPGELKFSDEDDDGGSEVIFGSADEFEGSLALSNVSMPSCYGITFTCHSEVKTFSLKVSCASYVRNQDDDGNKVWKRIPHEFKKEIQIQRENLTSEPMEVCRRLYAYVRFRRPSKDGDCSITVYLINRNAPGQDEEDASTRRNAKFDPDEQAKCSFFQVKFWVEESDGSFPFIERRASNLHKIDDEQKSVQLLYSHRKSYGVGHGCSVTWGKSEDGKVGSISSSFIPSYDTYPLVPPQDLGLPDFYLKEISNCNFEQLECLFAKVADKYEEWIDQAEIEKFPKVEDVFVRVAEEQFKLCRDSVIRIRRGIESLKDPVILEAFRLAHQAMLIVFAHGKWKKDEFDGKPDYDGALKWYPFQIAFILQCLESTARPNSEDRDVADLLWFPTGGGKTEAYLGLTAFVFFLRRLRALNEGGDGGGTSTLMRYTLRLLTADQFARASLMTCACEKIRRGHPVLSRSAEITIGLWVGSNVTANSTGESYGYRSCVDAVKKGKNIPEKGVDPLIIDKCPFCGTDIDVNEYNPRIPRIRCRSEDCEFNDELPLRFVDDDIYASRPSLVLGTVDKFARLPWVEDSGNIFGSDGVTKPPELIIQDELHLISGPLGTITGIYEAAIDMLCSKGKTVPKIVASTATIRNAVSQISGLFDRRFSQFPPPLLDARDSFFAREDTDMPARKYIGLFNPGKSGATSFIRSTACILHAPHRSEAEHFEKNPYWTFLGYFNSLRELGGARVQIMDDVNAYLLTCATRDGLGIPREIEDVCELTSRRNTKELGDAREDLWINYPDEDCLDAVIATNMISVGLDVPRLGLMTVVGQPKTTAEYIQASSRVGRKFPGLVVTLYNPMRSRDRSHYERFEHYHSRLYAEVEATSVTPWSVRSRDRALHAAFIAAVRHLCPSFRRNQDAGNFSRNAEVDEIVQRFVSRARSLDKREGDLTKEMLYKIISDWKSMATGNVLSYQDIKHRHQSLLVRFEEPGDFKGFRTMSSMRNVDPTANLYIK